MKSIKPFLYVIYTLLFICTLLMIYLNDSIVATFDIETTNRIWMYWALLGFVLLMLESVFENIHLSSVKRRQTRLDRENTELKAKLYDRHVGGEPTVRPPTNYPEERGLIK
jgi:hypothetical protein